MRIDIFTYGLGSLSNGRAINFGFSDICGLLLSLLQRLVYVRNSRSYEGGGRVSTVGDQVSAQPLVVAGAAVARRGRHGALQLVQSVVRRQAR